jgi:alkylated DNA repair protein (DNA oxidative demethylase)
MLEINGFGIHKGRLDQASQASLVEDLRRVVAAAPLVAPVTPSGRPMSVRMTACGRLGWVTDRRGYRYEPLHPSGAPWPPIPDAVLALWRQLCSAERDPDCCLVNFYAEGARMGMHRDADEGDFSWPVLSISLGDPARFRMGGPERGGPTKSILLESGDVVVMAGAARLAHHGVDGIRFGGSRLLAGGGRINLTCRVVA